MMGAGESGGPNVLAGGAFTHGIFYQGIEGREPHLGSQAILRPHHALVRPMSQINRPLGQTARDD